MFHSHTKKEVGKKKISEITIYFSETNLRKESKHEISFPLTLLKISIFFSSYTSNASPVGRTAITSQPLVPPIATDDEMKWNTPSSLELKHTPATPIPYFIFPEQLLRTPEPKSFQGNEFLSLFRIKVTYMVGGGGGGGWNGT